MEKAFPDYSVRRGFTANIIIEHIQRRDGEIIDDVEEALDRAKRGGVKNLLVQPTHLMNGYEYGDLVKELALHSCLMLSYGFFPHKGVLIGSGFDLCSIHEQVPAADLSPGKQQASQLSEQVFAGFFEELGTESCNG